MSLTFVQRFMLGQKSILKLKVKKPRNIKGQNMTGQLLVLDELNKLGRETLEDLSFRKKTMVSGKI